jgi:hypothetical protein
VNIDNPTDKVCVTVQAHAQDNGDKAPGKAMTYAVKTAVLKMFFFETGENDESRAESMDVLTINDQQQARLFELLCDPSTGNYTQQGLKVCAAFKFQNLNEVTPTKYGKILKQLGKSQ